MAMAIAPTLILQPLPTKTLSFSSSNSSFFNNKLKPLTINRSSLVNNSNKKGFSCTCLFGLGVPELVVIAGVVALVFGPKKLPEVGRSIGKTVKSFQQAAKEFETELKKEPGSLEENSEVTAMKERESEVPSKKESL